MPMPSSPARPSRLRALARAAGFVGLAGVLAFNAACVKEVLRYPHETAEGTAQSWADAFNRNEKGQLRLLVHPERRALYDEHRADVDAQLKAYDIQRWVMGERVVVNGTLEGREIKLYLADQAGVRENTAVLVQTDGSWWLWKY
jgi:hypothetical protein